MNIVKPVMVILCFLVLSARPLLAQTAGEVIIIFDQSVSMKYYDPLSTSKARLKSLIKALQLPYRISLSGFDEDIHQILSVESGDQAGMAELVNAIDQLEFGGFVTDLELPFRYLLKRRQFDDIKMVLIITDGKPEIWDVKLQHLSHKALADPRYKALNERYRALQGSLTHEQLFAELGPLYQRRNIELIERHLPGLVEHLYDKVTLWDLSGNSRYLETLAGLSGAQYVPMRVRAGEQLSEPLGKALLNSHIEQQIAAKTAAQAQAAALAAAKIEAKAQALAQAQEAQRAEAAAKAQAAASLKAQEEAEDAAQAKAAAAAQRRQSNIRNAIIALIIGLPVIWWWMVRRRARARRKESEIAD